MDNFVYPNGYNAKKYKNNLDNISALYFQAEQKYPSTEILEFYLNKFKEINWQSYVDEFNKGADKKWQFFIDASNENKKEQYIHQLIADWVDKDKTYRAILCIKYYSKKVNLEGDVLPDNDIQNITLQIMPFIELPEQYKGTN